MSAASWLKKNVLARPIDSLVSLLLMLLLLQFLPPILNWLIFDATFLGSQASDCQGGGACWVFITERIGQLGFGFYPTGERWRPLLVMVFLAVSLFFSVRRKGDQVLGALIITTLLFMLLIWALIFGSLPGLAPVPTDRWGGLMLTLVVAVTGIMASLPLGILLALGRRSQMPVIRSLSVAFIELWRGVPLITVLFMASVMLPLFLPEGLSFDKLLRCLIGVALFSSAYMAEVVRGGLQALPKGQYEAAEALGLSYWQSMSRVILPQALKLVIPGIVNTFIGLFKDTTLVLIVGLFDLLGVIQAAMTDPDWLGHSLEGYVFAALVFWIFCYGMSRYSQNLEKNLSLSH